MGLAVQESQEIPHRRKTLLTITIFCEERRIWIKPPTLYYGHGDAPIGDVSDETPYTFCGAVNLLSRYLVNNYGKDNVCFILPLHRRNEDNPFGEGNKKIKSGTLSEYITAEIIVLEKNGVKYLDLRNDFPPEKLDKLTIDGIHPNAKGHKLIADRVCEYLNEVSLRLF